MIPVLLRAGLRYHLQHRWQLALALTGVALGVAVVVAVDVATASARRAFDLSTEAVTGRATHEIDGGPAGIADSTYARLRTTLGDDIALAPVVDRYVSLPAYDGRVLRLLGVDPFAEAPFRDFLQATVAGTRSGSTIDVGTLMTSRAVILARETAGALQLTTGDTLRASAGRHGGLLVVGGVFDPHDDAARLALNDVALADISTAQELTGAVGVLDRVEVRIDGTAAAARIRAALPPGLRLIETETRTSATARLTRAFDTNLTALALVALVFGMFLIYNSISFSVVQRRPLLGLLRAQGVTTRELFAQIVAEAAVLGVVATAIGILCGSMLGSVLLRLVAQTINDLYFTIHVTSIQLGPATIVKAILLGAGATVAASLPPALEALRTPPRATLTRSVLERRAARAAPLLAMGGVASMLIASLLLVLPSRSITLGFASLFVLILAAALVTPAATILLMRFVRPLTAQLGAVGRMAPAAVTASLSRTAPAIAALAVALSVGIAVTVMITSFRNGVVGWLEQSLQADIYIAAPAIGAARSDAALDPELARAVAALPDVAGVSTYREVTMLLSATSASADLVRPPAEPDADMVRLMAFDPVPQHRTAFEMMDASPAAAWRAFDGGAVLVSEPLAWRRGLAAGDTLILPTDRGPAPFPIAAVYRDYASEHGIIFVERATYRDWWRDDAVTSLAVFTRAGTDGSAVLAQIRALPTARGALLRMNSDLRAATLEVFDRTFLITGVLRMLALIVAFVGVTGALMALQLERAREIGVLRTLGLTPWQVWSLITSQTALMGFAAAALATPLGIAMSWAMINVINRRSFGWSFETSIPATPFAQALAVGVAAAVLAGVYPAIRMARLRPAQVLRDE